MAANQTMDAALISAIQSAIQPKLIDNGWIVEDTDNTLAEYIIGMLTRGSDKDQMKTELGNDVLGVGADDSAVAEIIDWILELVPTLQAQISGANTAPAEQDTNGAGDAMVEDSPSKIPTGPKAMRGGADSRGRGGRMLGQMNRHLDRSEDRFKIKGAATGQSGRISKHAGRDGARGGRNGPRTGRSGPVQDAMGAMNPQQQQQLYQMMEMQSRMMAQIMNGQNPMFDMNVRPAGKSLFDRVERKGGRNTQQADVEMGEAERKDAFETVCRFNDKCTVPTCPFAHQSPAAAPGMSVDLSDTCSFGAACENRKCSGKHPSPAKRRAHLSQEVDCKFFPNCTNPGCPFRHPSMPPCRNGADCTDEGCKFSHSKIMCRYNPCLNPTCVYKHAEGQKRGTFEDKVWTNGQANSTADRFNGLTENMEEELIIPEKPEVAAAEPVVT